MDIKNLPIQKINLTKIPFKNLLIICLACVSIYSVRSCSIQGIELSRTSEEFKFKLSAQQRQFTKQLQEDSSIIATQKLNVFTERQAKELALIDNDRLKKIKSVVNTKTVTKIEKVFVPFNSIGASGVAFTDEDSEDDYEVNYSVDSLTEDDLANDTIKYFETETEWYSIMGSVQPNGVMFDDVRFNNKFSTTIGYQKNKGLLGFMKPKTPVVEIKSDNPYTDITSMENVVIENKKKFFQTTGFKVGAGLLGGFILFR